MRLKLRIALCAAISLLATPVTATTFGLGTSTDLTFTGNQPGTSATLSLILVGEATANSTDTYMFDYVLTNTSDALSNPSSRVSSFAFDDIGVETIGFTGTTLDANGLYASSFDASLPGLGTRDVCIFRLPGDCLTGSGGATIGDTATGSFSLLYNAAGLPPLTLDNFAVVFQDTGPNGTGAGTGIPALPEPSTWMLMLLGFGAISLSLRRGRQSLNSLPVHA